MYLTVIDESCIHRLPSKTSISIYPQYPSSLPTQQTIRSLPRKRSFTDEFSTFQQRDIITHSAELHPKDVLKTSQNNICNTMGILYVMPRDASAVGCPLDELRLSI